MRHLHGKQSGGFRVLPAADTGHLTSRSIPPAGRQTRRSAVDDGFAQLPVTRGQRGAGGRFDPRRSRRRLATDGQWSVARIAVEAEIVQSVASIVLDYRAEDS